MMKLAPSSPGEARRGDRAPLRLGPDVGVRRAEPAAPEQRVEMEPGGDAVDAVAVEGLADLVEVLLRELLRVVELVVVNELAEPVHRPPHPLRRRLAGPLRLIADGHEARDHRPEGPDAEAGPHVAGTPSVSS